MKVAGSLVSIFDGGGRCDGERREERSPFARLAGGRRFVLFDDLPKFDWIDQKINFK
jgi:hypothetical protein